MASIAAFSTGCARSACSTRPAAPAISSIWRCWRSRTSSTGSRSRPRRWGCAREFPRVGPEAVKGIEINPYAAELARVSVWIGEIQWMRRNGFDVGRNPILKPLDTIECRDAILNADGTEAEWPEADVVIGNPPFLGGKLLRDGARRRLCRRACSRLMKGRVPRKPTWWSTGSRRRGDGLRAGRSARRARRDQLDPRRRQPPVLWTASHKAGPFSMLGMTSLGSSTALLFAFH